MNFFTPELYAALGNDEEALAALIRAGAAYRRRLAELADVLPARTLALTNLSGLEDGLLFRMTRDPEGEHLTLTLRVGNIPIGYADLILVYEGAWISSADERTLAAAIATTRSHQIYEHDLRFHELDRNDAGETEHRLLFRPGLPVTVRCRSLDWTLAPRPDRTLPPR